MADQNNHGKSMHRKISEPDLWSLIGKLQSKIIGTNGWRCLPSSLGKVQASERLRDDQSHEDQVVEEEERSDLKDADVFRT